MRKICGEQFRAVLKKAQEESANGTRVAVAQMNKNKKFQKEQLAKDGYEEIVEFYKRQFEVIQFFEFFR